MAQGSFEKAKTYSLIMGGLALIGLFLPWVKASMMGYSNSVNGLHGEGFITLLGVGAVAAAVFMNGQNNPYDKNGKLITLIGFIAIIAGAAIVLFQVIGKSYVKMGLGLIICLAAGVIGLLLHLGKVKPPASIDSKVDKL